MYSDGLRFLEEARDSSFLHSVQTSSGAHPAASYPVGIGCSFPRGKAKVKVKLALRPAVYRQSVRLGVKPLETDNQRFFFNRTPAVIVLM
jgi:hypothetical protein